MGDEQGPAGMRDEQKVIAGWIERVRAAKGWSFERWAKEAGLTHASTISRAVKPDFDSLTRVDTLHQLARGAGMPSVLDFLENQDVEALPSAAELELMIRDVQTELPVNTPYSEWPRLAAAALHTRLARYAKERPNLLGEDDPEADARGPGASFRNATRPDDRQ